MHVSYTIRIYIIFILGHFASKHIAAFIAKPYTKNNCICVFTIHIFLVYLLSQINIFTLALRAMGRILSCEHRHTSLSKILTNHTISRINIQLSMYRIQVKLINCYFKQHLMVLLKNYKEMLYFLGDFPFDSNASFTAPVSSMDSSLSASFS